MRSDNTGGPLPWWIQLIRAVGRLRVKESTRHLLNLLSR